MKLKTRICPHIPAGEKLQTFLSNKNGPPPLTVPAGNRTLLGGQPVKKPPCIYEFDMEDKIFKWHNILASVSLSSSSCWTGLPRPTLAVSSRSCTSPFNSTPYFGAYPCSIMFLNHLYCRFISVTIRPACHNPIPSHLVLPPYAAAQQEHSGHKYENWNWTKFVFPPTRNCVIWHSGNIFARINSKWDDQPAYYFANDNDPFWHSEWAFFECDI